MYELGDDAYRWSLLKMCMEISEEQFRIDGSRFRLVPVI